MGKSSRAVFPLKGLQSQGVAAPGLRKCRDSADPAKKQLLTGSDSQLGDIRTQFCKEGGAGRKRDFPEQKKAASGQAGPMVPLGLKESRDP